MESPKLFLLFILVILLTFSKNAIIIKAQADDRLEFVSEDIELPMGMSLYEDQEDDTQLDGTEMNGRSLLWHRVFKFKYYISYGALSANRIPCPPRSGRSYYTHHCFSATGPAHPYTRGCSAITRCRR
ncbi:protein RALF-like 34 [Lycium ferocissimum]|uniref:protein RALF-like 34 n=1 Tax=Lycium ferocissimum TaxID=112874 RepID=UPI002815D5EE|nr:protein RALF-like 34 [Lycium ferocissimum]